MIRLLLVVALLLVLAGAAFLLLGSPRTAGAPDTVATTAPAPETAAPANSLEAENSFIVCPGDPRCP